jgi:hypothetical protein
MFKNKLNHDLIKREGVGFGFTGATFSVDERNKLIYHKCVKKFTSTYYDGISDLVIHLHSSHENIINFFVI